MRKDYLSPQEVANLWDMTLRYAKAEIKRMADIGLWNDRIVMLMRTRYVTRDAFEDYLKWKSQERKNGQK